MCSTNGMQQMGNVDPLSSLWPTNSVGNNAIRKQESVNTNVEQLLAQMHDLSFMLKDELSVPDKPVEHSKPWNAQQQKLCAATISQADRFWKPFASWSAGRITPNIPGWKMQVAGTLVFPTLCPLSVHWSAEDCICFLCCFSALIVSQVCSSTVAELRRENHVLFFLYLHVYVPIHGLYAVHRVPNLAHKSTYSFWDHLCYGCSCYFATTGHLVPVSGCLQLMPDGILLAAL